MTDFAIHRLAWEELEGGGTSDKLGGTEYKKCVGIRDECGSV